ncbi:MAG: ribosome assembly RNA-binding protein YhbY [Spirochaetia bacterium]
MPELTKKQRKYLFKAAHSLEPVVRIGKQGVTDQVVKTIDTALLDHELIKVKFGEFKEDKGKLSEGIAEATGSALVRIIGHIAIYYRPHPEEDKRRYVPLGI